MYHVFLCAYLVRANGLALNLTPQEMGGTIYFIYLSITGFAP
jgi:hypothetical protein